MRLWENNLNVSNTYPVFKKALKENERGISLSEELERIKLNKYGYNYRAYAQHFNDQVIGLTKRIYFEEGDSRAVKGLDDNTILEEVCWEDRLDFLFLRSNTDLILMNYEYKDIVKPLGIRINRIPTKITNRGHHVKKFEINGKIYSVINTFNSFLSFAEVNGYEPKLGVNTPFFNNFFISLNQAYLQMDKESHGMVTKTIHEYNNINGEICMTFSTF